jgi:hypothetical protein
MRPWPWHSFSIDCDVPPDLASVLIASQVAPAGWFTASDGKPFRGTVEGREFELVRVIRYRNSFLPVVHGRIEPAGDGSRVHVGMRLYPVVMVFLVLFAGMLGTQVVSALFTTSAVAGAQVRMLQFPLGMLAFLWVMTIAGFWIEARKQERMLREIFGGK